MPLHAGAQGPVVVVLTLRLLLLILPLRGLLLALLVASTESADQTAGSGTHGGAFADVPGNRADHCAGGRPPRAAPQHAALRRLLRGPRLLVHGIEAGLLGRPGMTFAEVTILLVLTLPLGRIEEDLLGGGRLRETHNQGAGQLETKEDSHYHSPS